MKAAKISSAKTHKIHPGDPVVKLIIPEPIDPVKKWKDEIMARVGDCAWIREYPTDVLVVKYIRQTVGASGVLVAASNTQREDGYQSKVGLVIKCGSQTFVDGDDANFHGFKASIGEWAVYRPSTGWDFNYIIPGTNNMIQCRLLRDTDIKAVVPNPNVLY